MKTKGLGLVLLLGLLLVACAGTPQQPTALHVLRPASSSPIYGKGKPFPRLERTCCTGENLLLSYRLRRGLPTGFSDRE